MKSTYKARWGHDRKAKTGVNVRMNEKRKVALENLKKQITIGYYKDKDRDRMRDEIKTLESRIYR